MKKKTLLLTAIALVLTPIVNANDDRLLGALIGGIIGNQIGSSSHNQYVGAGIGYILAGNGGEYNRHHYYRPPQGYYKLVQRKVWVAPKYEYIEGRQYLVREGYYRYYYERIYTGIFG